MSENSKKVSIKRKTNVPFTENYKYICEYCKIEYIPKRRHHQKYCSNSCRSKNHRLKVITNKEIPQLEEKTKTKIEKMSVSGIGNAAAGTAFVEIAKSIFTSEENKTATKKDLKELAKRFDTYHKIKRIYKIPNGAIPFFNMDTKEVVFFFEGHLPKI